MNDAAGQTLKNDINVYLLKFFMQIWWSLQLNNFVVETTSHCYMNIVQLSTYYFFIGSRTSLIRLAGLKALNNIIEACGYQNVTNLIQINSDYFSYHVVRKLNKFEQNESVLNVLAVVMNYSTVDVLPSFTNIVDVVSFGDRQV